MARWTCPGCDREFGRSRQAHVCVPGITVAELLARHPTWVAELYGALAEHVHTLGPVHEDAVEVGVFLKSDRTFAEFRPQVRAVALWLASPAPLDSPRVARIVSGSGPRVYSVVKLREPADVDDQLRGWLTDAYAYATDDG